MPAVVTTLVAVMVVVIVMTVAVALIGRLSVARDRPHDLPSRQHAPKTAALVMSQRVASAIHCATRHMRSYGVWITMKTMPYACRTIAYLVVG